MIKFIVIEDDKKYQAKVKEILKTITFDIDEEINISFYQKMTPKLREDILDKTDRKIFIIDIELENNYSGVQIAKMIRERDWESEIVFMTNHDKMFETVYRNVYKVFDFIKNFITLKADLKKILKRS